MNHARIAFIMSILILSSVGASAMVNTAQFDGSWVLTSARAPETIEHATLTIEGASFSGNTACNRYGGTFTFTDDGYVSIENVVKTSAACVDPDLNEDENRYIEAFSTTRIMRITPSGALTLQGFAQDSSVVILTYERADEPTEHLIGVIGVNVSATVEPGEEATLSFVVADRRSEGAPVRYFLNYGGHEHVKMLANPMQFSLGPGERETITITASSRTFGRHSFAIEVLEEAHVGTLEQETLAEQILSLTVHNPDGREPVSSELDGRWILSGSRMPDGRPINDGTLAIKAGGFNANTACNTVFGSLAYGSEPNEWITIRVEGGTERYCDDLANAHERRYIEALNAVSNHQLERGVLVLSGSLQGTRFELRYTADDPDQPFEPPGIQPIIPAPTVTMLNGYYVSEDRSRGGMIRVQYGGFQTESARALIVIGSEHYDGILKLDGDPGTTFEIEFRCVQGDRCPQMSGAIRTYESLIFYEGTLTLGSPYEAVLFAHRWTDTPDTPSEHTIPDRIREGEQLVEQALETAVIGEPQITFHGVERPRILGFIPNPFAEPLARFTIRTEGGSEQHRASVGSVIEVEDVRYRVHDDRIEQI